MSKVSMIQSLQQKSDKIQCERLPRTQRATNTRRNEKELWTNMRERVESKFDAKCLSISCETALP